MHPFRFGVVFTGEQDGEGWEQLARRVEDLGFSTLLVADHLLNPMACTPLIAAAAAATTTLRVGSYVFCNDFRHPAVLAKEVATIDVLSGGRTELGLGAGWLKIEYDLAGIPFDPPGIRLDRFEESVGVIRQLLAGEVVEHSGAHYELHGHPGMPRPRQERIPLLIGGGGPRMLTFAAREADIVGLVPRSLPGGGLDPAAFGADAVDRGIRDLEAGIAAADRIDDGPERSVCVFGAGAAVDDELRVQGVDPATVDGSPYALRGDPVEMIDTIRRARDRWGLTYWVCFERSMDALVPAVERLAGT